MKQKKRKGSDEALVSVIIPSMNRRDELRRALLSVYQQEDVKKEVIVVDDASTDGTPEMILKEFHDVILIRNENHIGVNLTKDQGILRSRGDYLYFMDSDAELVYKDCLKTMVDLLATNPDIGAIGSEAYPKSEGQIEHLKKIITFNGETLSVPIRQDHYELLDASYVSTCNMMIPRDLLEECGGFDSYTVFAGADKELGYRLRCSKYRSVVDSRCLAYHYFSPKTRISNLYLSNRNRIRFVIKYYPWYVIPILPILDILSLASMRRLSSVIRRDIFVMRWISKKDISKISFVKFIFTLGFDVITSFIKAYAWNLVHLPRTLKERVSKENYLEVLRRGNN